MTGRRRIALAVGACALFGWVTLAGCSDDGTATTSSSSSGAGGSGGFTTGSGGNGGITNECASAIIEGDPIPVTMIIMFDKSGSMLFDQKWTGAKTALIAFFQDEASAGLSVALRFFPDDEPMAGCNDVACNIAACATPLVDAGELNELPAYADPQQDALVAAVQSKAPEGQTPMYAALAGATQWAQANIDPEGIRQTVVVLVTDGEPNGCNEDIGAISSLAADALSGGNVLTYAIGMEGSNLGQLDQIASAGGTDTAFVVGNSDVHKGLMDALKEIRKSKLDCEFPMPQSEDVGDEVNPGEINVTYSSAGHDPQTLGQVPSSSACDSGGGWYYDDPDTPTTIYLCPATCDLVQSDSDAQVSIVVGCKTVLR